MKTRLGFLVALAVLGFSSSAFAQSQNATCNGADDCKVKWQRALQWLMDNSKYPINEQTDTHVTTIKRLGTQMPFGDSSLIFTLDMLQTKKSDPNGFTILFRAGCSLFFGECTPTIDQARASFVRYVMGGGAPRLAQQPAPSAAPAAPGAAPAEPGSARDESILPNAQSYTLVCKGGGAMVLHFDYKNNAINKTSNQIALSIDFERAPQAANVKAPGAGQCAYEDRTVRADEPNSIYVSGDAGDVGFEMTASGADRKITAYSVSGSGAVHDNLGYLMNSVLNGADFSVPVSDISTIRLQVVGTGSAQ